MSIPELAAVCGLPGINDRALFCEGRVVVSTAFTKAVGCFAHRLCVAVFLFRFDLDFLGEFWLLGESQDSVLWRVAFLGVGALADVDEGCCDRKGIIVEREGVRFYTSFCQVDRENNDSQKRFQFCFVSVQNLSIKLLVWTWTSQEKLRAEAFGSYPEGGISIN